MSPVICHKGTPGRPSHRSKESYEKAAKRRKDRKKSHGGHHFKTHDDGFEQDFSQERAKYDYMPIMQQVVSGGGNVSICNLRENEKPIEFVTQCPHCNAQLDKRRIYTMCPVCKMGIRGNTKRRKNASVPRALPSERQRRNSNG